MNIILRRFHLSDTKTKVVSNVYWAVLGKCVNLLGALVVGIIVARYLGPEQYGLMNYVISYVAVFQVLADFGLDSIQIREEARDVSKRNVILGTTFVLKFVLAVIAVLLTAVTVFLFETDCRTRWFIMMYSVSMILNSTWVFRNHFTSMVWNEYVVKTEITRTIFGAAIKILLLYLHAGLIYFIGSLVFDSMLLASGYIFSYSRKIGRVTNCEFDMDVAKGLITQSFPLLLSGAAIVIYCRIDQLMIGNMLDKAQLGIYSVSIQFTNVLIFVPTIIAQTVGPVLVGVKEKDEDRYRVLASRFMDLTVWICVLIAICISLVSYPLVMYTFGKSYISAASILSIMAFKVVGDALSQTSGQLMIIEGVQKYASVRNFIGCIVCVILNFALIQKYGTMGTAFVSMITIISSGFLANFIIPQYRHIFKLQVSSICFGWKSLWNIGAIKR